MTSIRHEDLPIHHFPGFRHQTVAGRHVGGAPVEVWHQVAEPGATTPRHHHDCDEVVVLLRGRARCTIGDLTEVVEAPATILLPGGQDHELTFLGPEPSECIAVFSGTPAPVYAPDGSRVPVPWDA